ncbi:MAG: pilus assembly protein CpaB [Actinomycetota bacterium]|jgi:Flp pilus assembly protein CpaB
MSLYRVRFFLRRFPVGYWLAAFLLVALTFAVVSSLVGRASAAAARWGELRPVAVVARSTLSTGTVVASGDVVVRLLPASVVPAGALRRPPVGRTVLAPLTRDEVVTAARVGTFLPEGGRALAVPVGPGTPPLRRGDRVDVLVTFDKEPTFAVAEGAGVLAVTDAGKSVTVALTPDEAPRVAFALAQGTVTLAQVR